MRKYRDFIEDVVAIVMTFIGGILLLILLATVQPANAQNVVRNGNTFKFETTQRQQKDTLLTDYRVEYGEYTYPVIVNKNSGRCWAWVKRQNKPGMYRKYLPKQVAKQVATELGIKYVEK